MSNVYNNIRADGFIQLVEIAEPSTPPTANGRIYTKTGTDSLFWKPDTGVEATISITDHGGLAGLGDDDHTQYALLAGRSGGQTIYGSTITTEGLRLTPNSSDITGAIAIGTTGTDYLLPGTRGTSGQYLQTNGSGVVGWSSLTSTRKHTYTLTTAAIVASAPSFVTVAYFPWDVSEYATYTNGTVRFYVDGANGSTELIVQLWDGTQLGASALISSNGVHTFSVTNPVADASLELRVQQTGVVNPTIKGATLDYETETTLSSNIQYARAVIDDGDSPYTVLNSDEIIGVDTRGGPVTVTLPQISTIGGSNYKKYFISDEGANAGTNNISIATTGGDTISSAPSPFIINVNASTVSIYSDGSSNWIIF